MSVLSRLVDYSETIADHLPTPAYAESTVHCRIRLNLDGSLYTDEVQFLETEQLDKKGRPKKAKPGQKRSVPHIRRNAVLAKVITDTAEYVLGDGKKAEAYLTLLERCAAATQDPAVKAVLTFVKNRPSLANSIDPSQVIEFSVVSETGELELVHDRPSVKRFWAAYVEEVTGAGDRPIMQCLATGEMAPVATKFALQVKGVPGTNTTGGSLVSAYDKTTSSYGLVGALVSPISAIADEQLSQALSYLLRHPDHHFYIGNIAYAFWADSGNSSLYIWENPNASEVRDYLHQLTQPNQKINPDWQFHILALTGNAGRVVVRDWVEIAEPIFAQRYQQWLDHQSKDLPGFDRRWQDRSGKEHHYGYLNVYQIARSGVRDSKEILPRTVNSIVRNILFREPLPIDLIQRVCHRNRIERNVLYDRALVLNLYRNDLIQENKVVTEDKIAFQYGRLLAAYAQLQCAAQRTDLANTNAMRAYQSAGCSPLIMSHRLASGAKNHLAILSGGLQYWYSQRLAEINAQIAKLTSDTSPIPQFFSTQAQAHFDLGFWSELNSKKEEAPETVPDTASE